MKEVWQNLKLKNITMYILGLILMGLGISLYLNTKVGAGIWDVLHKSLFDFYGLTVGTWITIVGILVILLSQLISYKPIRLLSIITGLFMGIFIDLWQALYNVTKIFTLLDNMVILWLIFAFALLAIGSGISLLVLSLLPVSPIDVLMVSYHERFKWNFTVSKIVTESTAFIVALIIGGINGNPFVNMGLGTVIAIFSIGIFIDLATPRWKRLFKINDNN